MCRCGNRALTRAVLRGYPPDLPASVAHQRRRSESRRCRAFCLYQWHHGPAQVRAAYPRQRAVVVAQYRRALWPDFGGLQPGGNAIVPRSRIDRRYIVDPGFRRHQNRVTALFSIRVLETVPRAARTWDWAVPTIHQVLLARADSDGAPHRGLRFIRSCSAALAPAILTNLENRFGAPVLEAYGMTEAAHQVASNPLPPLAHKPGTVGPGAGISIIDETGRHPAANTPGEVVVRGPNVMRGYRNNAEANASAFIDGWFRTGDIGVVDNDGYLALLGRIKELIKSRREKKSHLRK